jgi:hypothetical protein
MMLMFVGVAGLAAHQAVARSQSLDEAADRLVSVNAAAAQVEIALAEIAAAERGYVAPGQGLDFWAGKVDESVAAARSALGTLQASGDANAATQAAAALSRLDDFVAMDQRARDYARVGRLTMAADLIFADGFEMIAAARTELGAAVTAARTSIAAPVSRDRQLRLASVGALGAIALLASLLLLRGPKAAEAPAVISIAPESIAPASEPRTVSVADDSIGAALDASLEGLDDFAPAALDGEPSPVGRPVPVVAALPVINMEEAADVCVDLGRLLDARDLQSVLARMAAVLDANGLIVWLADTSGHSLSPVLTHGYGPALVGRLGNLPVDEDNPTTEAWRAKAVQVVDGALAVPLLTSQGCTGVLAVEMKNGRERAAEVQALSRIVAAQLAATVAAPAPAARKAAEA